MTEKTQVWYHVKQELGPLGHLTRIEYPVIPGTPDVLYTIKGVTGWLELKKLSGMNKCTNLTIKQVAFAEAVTKAGGLWFLLGRYKQTWLLYNLEGARLLLKGGEPCPLLSISGPLPVKELVGFLVGNPKLKPL